MPATAPTPSELAIRSGGGVTTGNPRVNSKFALNRVADRNLRGGAWRIAFAIASGGLLALAYLYPPFWALSWVGWAPLLLAIEGTRVRSAYALGSLAGATLHIGATYWVATFIAALKGYDALFSLGIASLLWLYSAQAIGIVAALFVWLKRASPIPAWLLFPVIVVTACVGFPTLFTVRLGETQSSFLPALQAIEFTGLYGLDFVIAFVNGAIFCWIARAPEPVWRSGAIAAGVLVALWLGYGVYALAAWDKDIAASASVRIGLVQPNEAPHIEIPGPHPGYSRGYPREMEVTSNLVANGAELVIWPETRFKGYLDNDYVQRAFQGELRTLRTPLLFQDQHHVYRDDRAHEYNTAVFVNADGNLAGTYRKRQRIAFGEYVPIIGDIPAVRSWAQRYLAVDEVSAGGTAQVFRTGRFALVPLICYEVAFPVFVAKSLPADARGSILVILSNDSWFGDTREPHMHARTAVLRAVENRVPLIHVLNNGPSTIVAPDGRILFQSKFRATGGYVVDMPYAQTRGGSFFSRHPYWFLTLLYTLLVLIVLSACGPNAWRWFLKHQPSGSGT